MRLPSSSHQSSPSSDPKHAGVHLSGQQLEIFPLHPGTNPARPQDDGRRANRSRGLSPARSAGRCSVSQRVLDRPGTDQRCPRHRTQQPCCTGSVAHWSVAQEAWKAVEKFRAARHGVATVVQQGIAATILQPETEENQQQLTVVEQVLAMAGFSGGSGFGVECHLIDKANGGEEELVLHRSTTSDHGVFAGVSSRTPPLSDDG